MKLHEFQAKDLLADFGIPSPEGQLVKDSDQASKVAGNIPGPPWVVKAQVLTGGRGKAGGIKIVPDPDKMETIVKSLLNKSLVTKQTGSQGVVVRQVLIESGVDIEREFYLSMVVDRATARPTMIFSQAGGMEIEEVSDKTPELILKEHIDPGTGWMPYHARKLIYQIAPIPSPSAIKSLASVMANVYKAFITLDCSLLEINPLVLTREDKILALDAKLQIDDNALFRQKDLKELDDPEGKDPFERMAEKYQLNYIRLDGNIGAMVNGAGLAMATMDLIKLAGAEPANFLDVGGGASEEMITKGFEIILQDKRVKAILINIFGGILRCDVLARGVLAAAKSTDIKVPLIVRLEGTNVDEGRRILKKSDLQFLVARDLTEAADLVTKQVKGEE